MAVAQRLNVTQAKTGYPCAVVTSWLYARFSAKPCGVARTAHTASTVPLGARVTQNAGVVTPRPAVERLELWAIKVMLGDMSRMIRQFKILQTVVSTITVFVVDNFTRFKGATKGLFHDKPMFSDISLTANLPVFRTGADSHIALVVNTSSALPAVMLRADAFSQRPRHSGVFDSALGNALAPKRTKLWWRRVKTTCRGELVIAGGASHCV